MYRLKILVIGYTALAKMWCSYLKIFLITWYPKPIVIRFWNDVHVHDDVQKLDSIYGLYNLSCDYKLLICTISTTKYPNYVLTNQSIFILVKYSKFGKGFQNEPTSNQYFQFNKPIIYIELIIVFTRIKK